MNCTDARQQIFAERDGALDDTQRAALAEHVAGCAACRRVRDDLAALVEVWRADVHDARAPSPELEWQKLRRRLHGVAPSRRRAVAAWIGAPIATVAAVVVGLYLAPSDHPHAAGSTREIVAANERPTVSPVAAAGSTVVYVDDKSGWTFVWEPTNGNDRRI